MSFFKKNSHPTLAIDLSPFSITCLELHKKHNNWILHDFQRKYITQSEKKVSESNKEFFDLSLIIQNIQDIYQQGAFKTKQVTTALPNTHLITKKLTLSETLNDLELKEHVLLEVEKYIPYAINMVAFDFEKLNKTGHLVEWVACRKECIDIREKLLSLSGLQPKAIESVTHALARTYPLLQKQLKVTDNKTVIGVFYIGDTTSTFSILQNSQAIYVQNITFNLKKLAIFMSNQKETEITMARCFSLDQSLITPSVESALILEISRQLSRCLEQFYTIHDNTSIHAIILSGNFPMNAFNLKTLSKNIGINFFLANPFQDMQVNKSIDMNQLKTSAASLLIACGLSMRNSE
ncbi:MAG: type IV pilus assembly protein PilM [Endozoicomonadaceae bacterium]|nr:type IV pilus assembly protein PilM [Endozoicomonadaceae bacterium]